MRTQSFDVTQLSDFVQTVQSLRHRFLGKTIYLYGDLGTGKTTFAQHWLSACGVDDAITSPTYTVVNEYPLFNGQRAIHADLYRINEAEELIYLDVRDWTENTAIILIEWPEVGEGLLPLADAQVHLSLQGGHRHLVWQDAACAASLSKKD